MTTNQRIPSERQERFNEVAAVIEEFGQKHLDPELTGFVIDLWKRVCRRRTPDCMYGKPAVWAASVTHVIARRVFGPRLCRRPAAAGAFLRTRCSWSPPTPGHSRAPVQNLRHAQSLRPRFAMKPNLDEIDDAVLRSAFE